MDIFSPYIVLPVWLIRFIVLKLFKKKLEVGILTFFYGLFLILQRTFKGSFVALRRAFGAAREIGTVRSPKVASRVTELNSVYRMRGLEVILGFDAYRRPIRVDLGKHHTLIAGVTGSGKTNLLNSIICQLVGRGKEFSDEYDIYLVDLKGFDKTDFLPSWKPLLTGYYAIDEDGSTESAIAALRNIILRLRQSQKQSVVIIDELAMLTSQAPTSELRKQGHAVLMRLASQLRARGTLIGATQRPHYETVGRGVSGNMETKVCLRTDDNANSAFMILRHKPRHDATKLRNGEFILKEPGRMNNEVVARSMLMALPGEIDMTVYAVMADKIQEDERLKLFARAASTLKIGANVPGVQRVKGDGWSLPQVQDAYWNYVKAGAFIDSKFASDGRPTQRKLVHEYQDAFALVNDYIRQGLWQASPRDNKIEVEEE